MKRSYLDIRAEDKQRRRDKRERRSADRERNIQRAMIRRERFASGELCSVTS